MLTASILPRSTVSNIIWQHIIKLQAVTVLVTDSEYKQTGYSAKDFRPAKVHFTLYMKYIYIANSLATAFLLSACSLFLKVQLNIDDLETELSISNREAKYIQAYYCITCLEIFESISWKWKTSDTKRCIL